MCISSLAGMLHKVGLLPPGNYQQVPFAYKMYTRANECGWLQSKEFKSAFSMDVPIEFIGVWYVSSSNKKSIIIIIITRIAGILFLLLVPSAEDHCQLLQLVPMCEHSDMRYLLMNDEQGFNLTFGKRNRLKMSTILTRKIIQKPKNKVLM